MTIESALIARAQPQMIAAQARDIIRREIQKGCSAEISPVPVSLEPTFRPLWLSGNNPYGQEEPDLIPEEPASPNQFIRLRIWISPEHGLDWNQSELFIKQLQGLRHRAAFEISGNRDSILMTFLVHRKDAAILRSSFNGEYVSSELTILKDPFIGRTSDKGQTGVWFRDYFLHGMLSIR
jgi:hypothetical protein